MQGKLFVISGPSGAGKGTICKALQGRDDIYLSISMTTRAPRTGEVDGREYYFVTREEFQKTIDEGGFLEHAETYGNCYGTPKKPMEDAMAAGKDVILEIDMKGAAQVRRVYPDAILVFVLPPSLKVLRQRIRNRGTETEEAIRLRMSQTLSEIHEIVKYDYYVINNDLKAAIDKTIEIMAGKGKKIDQTIQKLIDKYNQEEKTL